MPLQMLDGVASPGDPTFYLHHTWLDKIFWDWQALDLPARLSDMGGRNGRGGLADLPTEIDDQGPPITLPDLSNIPAPDALVPPVDAPPQVPKGDCGNTTTLAHVLNMFGVIPNARIADVMDIGGPLLCYEYV